MKDMDFKSLIEYEAPAIAEYISNKYFQNIVAKYLSWKIEKKLLRYRARKKTEEELRKILSTTHEKVI